MFSKKCFLLHLLFFGKFKISFNRYGQFCLHNTSLAMLLFRVNVDNLNCFRSWLQFEREEGSLDAFEQCRKLIKIKMEKISAVRDKENRSKQEEDYQLNAKIEKKKVNIVLKGIVYIK